MSNALADDSRLSVACRHTRATPAQVWQVLADGWLYASWVVGASWVRQVDESWPQEGARIHHSFGVWPGVIDDITTVMQGRPRLPGSCR